MNCCIKTVEGTLIKFIVSLSIPDGFTMDDADFTIAFFIYPNKKKEIAKADMVRINKNYYRAALDTDGMGSGRIAYQIDIAMPDGSTDIIRGDTDETLSSQI
ncbi:MAG: hypothetical protein LBS55_02190 [Prevotellaceae bacterium]|jgi:hypothetical protein|nr:hypothetical protein [Prevotellaceae bacterium]